MLDLERLFRDRLFYDEFALGKKVYLPMNALRGVRDNKDFEQWEGKYSPIMRSKQVKSIDAVSTLDQFFGD